MLEIKRSVKLLRLGLGSIREISGGNDFYDPPMLFLSAGIERLYKSILCLNYKEVHGKFPEPNKLWSQKNGHNLLVLNKKVRPVFVPLEKSFLEEDYPILTQNPFIEKLLEILTHFGMRGRYFDLDSVLGNRQAFNPTEEWEKLEKVVGVELYGREEYFKKCLDSKTMEQLYVDTNRAIIIKIEKYLRAVARQFRFGQFSSDSRFFLFEFETFSDIDDKTLGEVDYRQFSINQRVKRKN